MATLYGVGIGPGDPELVTLKALRVIRRVPVICAPHTRQEGESIAGEIVAAVLSPEVMRGKEFLTLHFPMTRDKVLLERAWEEAAQQVVQHLQAGTDVAFVTLGDPSFYSTYPYLERAVRSLFPEVRTEVVPGVTSFSACAAAGGAAVQGNERLAVVPVTGADDLEAVVRDFNCTILLKAGRHLDEVRKVLDKIGLQDKAQLYERCGFAGARQGPLGEFAEADYLSLVVVKK
ncbi:MAG: precorrin-2 C(20)-methyltransferase [Bacillota bacterium]